MAGIAVTVSMGVMKPLLDKLAKLMGDEYKKLKGLRKEVSFVKRELSDMHALLEKMDDVDELDPQAKNWRKDIIEMSYDLEDYIDDFMNRVGEADDIVGVLQKASHYLRTFKDRRRLANQFQEIKSLVVEAGKRRKRHMLDQCIQSTTHVIVDPRMSALYEKSESLVGIGSQKEEIVRWVMDEGQQLKVMSIFGFGGLGKTTLANEIYREVGGKFNSKAFVSISQNPDIMKILNSLMLQLGLQPYSHDCELQDLINNIIKYLQDMRYFIIFDDLWDVRAWNIISCAFPRNNHYSRVMVTTRIENVARASSGNNGFIHYLKPLSEQDSRKLFFDRIFESEDACSTDFIEVSCKILKKCGGLPLAIITMASMIACQPTISKWQWAQYIQNSLCTELATNPTYEDMMHILDFSYKNLPHHLKACFLYLGTYPEDHKIDRVEVARRWVAEGFVSCSCGQDIWDVAESYFSELVNRSMIQLVYEYLAGIEMSHYRLHDMMLELILRKCREHNFISLIDGPEMMSEGQDKVIRRLTIDSTRDVESGITVVANNRHLSQLRSLNVFRGNCRIPNLTKFKFMRLLFLYVPHFLETVIDLSSINHLSQLRYLRITGCGNKVLVASQIGGLRVLETLDFSEMVPSEIVDVPRLSHVSVSSIEKFALPNWVGKVKSLVTLNGFHLSTSSLESIRDLGELPALSELILQNTTLPGMTLISALITSLEKLGNLKSLVLNPARITAYDGDDMLRPSFSPHFRKIERLYLQLLIFSGVPRWIGDRELQLVVKQVHQEDFNIIGRRLTSLVKLTLLNVQVPLERIVIGDSMGFKVLRKFMFDCDGVSYLTFEARAMPALQELILAIDPTEWDKAPPEGLQHLPSLKTIDVFSASKNTISSITARRAREGEMWGMFQEVADAHK